MEGTVRGRGSRRKGRQNTAQLLCACARVPPAPLPHLTPLVLSLMTKNAERSTNRKNEGTVQRGSWKGCGQSRPQGAWAGTVPCIRNLVSLPCVGGHSGRACVRGEREGEGQTLSLLFAPSCLPLPPSQTHARLARLNLALRSPQPLRSLFLLVSPYLALCLGPPSPPTHTHMHAFKSLTTGHPCPWPRTWRSTPMRSGVARLPFLLRC